MKEKRDFFDEYFRAVYGTFYTAQEKQRIAAFLIKGQLFEKEATASCLDALDYVEQNNPQNAVDCANLILANSILTEEDTLRSDIHTALSSLSDVIAADPLGARAFGNRVDWLARLYEGKGDEQLSLKALARYAFGDAEQALRLLEKVAARFYFPAMKNATVLALELEQYEKAFYYSLAACCLMERRFHVRPDEPLLRLNEAAGEKLSASARDVVRARVEELSAECFGGAQKKILGFAG